VVNVPRFPHDLEALPGGRPDKQRRRYALGAMKRFRQFDVDWMVTLRIMKGRPAPEDATPRSYNYISLIEGDDCLAAMTAQLNQAISLFAGISEEKSLHRYSAEKWSIRQMLNHVADSERVFAFRALWLARGIDASLPGFNPEIAASAIHSDRIPWKAHVEEFRHVRQASIDLFRNLPADAWTRRGTIGNSSFTVLALGFVVSGHLEHHMRILRERYL